jgi:hypothetical protein
MSVENRDLQDLYDLELSEMIIQFSQLETQDELTMSAPVTTEADSSSISLDSSSLLMLLGRNGAGKTLLLSALQNYSSQAQLFPKVSFLFTVPSAEKYEQYEKSYKKFVESPEFSTQLENLNDGSYLGPGELAQELMGLPFSNGFYDALSNVLDSHDSDDWRIQKEEIPDFDNEEIKQVWQYQQSINDLGELNASETNRRFTRDALTNIRSFAPGYLLHHYLKLERNNSQSVVNTWFNEPIFPAARWFSRPKFIADAVFQFFSEFQFVELLPGNTFRLLAERPVGGPLHDFMKERELDEQEAEKLDIGRLIQKTTFGFPQALFETIDLSGKPYVASRIMPLHDQNSQWSPIAVESFSPEADALVKAQSLLWKIFAQNSAVEIDHSDDGGMLINVTIPQAIRDISRSASDSIARCKVGVAGIRIVFPKKRSRHDWLHFLELHDEAQVRQRIEAGLGMIEQFAESAGVDTSPVIEWQDELTSKWLAFGKASLGQQQVILLMLRLQDLTTNPKADNHNFIISDEFDRNLHPDASRAVLQEIMLLLNFRRSLSVVLSTHSIPALGMPPLSGIERIYAERTIETFRYSQSSSALVSTIEDILGVSSLDALRLKRLHVLVEGLHDELVIADVIRQQIPDIPDINIINGNGVNSWGGIIGNSLRLFDAPILLIYDKKSNELEDAWKTVVDQTIENGVRPAWGKTGLSRLRSEVEKRKRTPHHGDHELLQILNVFKHHVFKSDKTLIRRIHLCGLRENDVVDYLPIKSFPKASQYGETWKEVHDRFRAQNKNRSGENFKTLFEINETSVRRAIKDNADFVHEELGNLANLIRKLATGID